MTSINSILSTQSLPPQAPISASTSVSSAPAGREAHSAKREQDLVSALTAAGVDEDTTEAIKTDLKAAFEANLSEEKNRANAEAFKEEVDGIFAEYGLEASEFVGRPGGAGRGGPPPGGGPPKSGGAGQKSYATDDTSEQYETVLELLEGLASDESDPAELAQLIVDALYGLDETA